MTLTVELGWWLLPVVVFVVSFAWVFWPRADEWKSSGDYSWPLEVLVFPARGAVALAAARREGFDACKEQAAEVAHNFTGAQHAAHDMRTGVFPKQSHMGEAIAAAIRALEPKS